MRLSRVQTHTSRDSQMMIIGCLSGPQNASISTKSALSKLNALAALLRHGGQRHRRHQAFDVWKRSMWDTGCKLPTEMADGRSRCYCGAEIVIAGVEPHVSRVGDWSCTRG
jgi:hypothetical protein